MDEQPPDPAKAGPEAKRSRFPAVIRSLVTAILASAAIAYFGYNVVIGLDIRDTNTLESTLILAVEREATRGFGDLYGPFSGSNPLVLIHAPLYYRIAGAAAMGLVRSDFDPTIAALASGRAISFLAMIAILIAAAAIACVDGSPGRAGIWSASLIASSGIFGSFAVTVRPDTLGIALQTIGFGLALRGLRDRKQARWLGLPAAYACFALAFVTKQLCVVPGLVATGLLLVAALRGRVRWGSFLVGLVLGAGIVAGYVFAEEVATSGQMSQSVFSMPSRLNRTVKADWGHVGRVYLGVAKLGIGMIALALACVVAGFRKLFGTWLDGVLWLAFLAEIGATIPTLLGSVGAWYNIPMPATVYAAILLGRAMARILEGPSLRKRSIAIPLAGLVLLAADVRLVVISASQRGDEAGVVAELLEDATVLETPQDRRCFLGLPQYNRLYGNRSLVCDDWLYQSFESLDAAEPRSAWLRQALAGHPVNLVVVSSEGDGVEARKFVDWLPGLGYTQRRQIGRYAIWSRSDR